MTNSFSLVDRAQGQGPPLLCRSTHRMAVLKCSLFFFLQSICIPSICWVSNELSCWLLQPETAKLASSCPTSQGWSIGLQFPTDPVMQEHLHVTIFVPPMASCSCCILLCSSWILLFSCWVFFFPPIHFCGSGTWSTLGWLDAAHGCSLCSAGFIVAICSFSFSHI